MTISTSENGNVRTVTDDMNPRIFVQEFKCEECGEWVAEEDTVWVDPVTGEATTGDKGKPYHDYCAPEEHED